MKKSHLILYSVLGFVLLLIVFGGIGTCSSYNSMVTEEEQVNNAWGNVQSQYQRRFDLFPNLVSTVKGYARHEKETFTEVTAMRAGQVDAAGDALVAEANALKGFNGPDGQAPDPAKLQKLDRAYGLYINAVHEAYPQLSANQNFLDLQTQIEGTENRINYARDQYNKAVQQYNVKVRRFPNSIIAGMFGFGQKQMFVADAAASSAPKVSFDE